MSTPSADVVVPFAQGTARILKLSEVRNLDAWSRAFQDKCKDHRYYALIEQTLANDFEYRYVVLEDASGKVRGIQPILFVRQNLIEGMRGPFRAIVDLVRRLQLIRARKIFEQRANVVAQLAIADASLSKDVASKNIKIKLR